MTIVARRTKACENTGAVGKWDERLLYSLGGHENEAETKITGSPKPGGVSHSACSDERQHAEGLIDRQLHRGDYRVTATALRSSVHF
jgi:hypothetical protein